MRNYIIIEKLLIYLFNMLICQFLNCLNTVKKKKKNDYN